jgi:hypothetical protein
MAIALRTAAGKAPHAPVAATPPPAIRRKSRLLLSITNSDEPDFGSYQICAIFEQRFREIGQRLDGLNS